MWNYFTKGTKSGQFYEATCKFCTHKVKRASFTYQFFVCLILVSFYLRLFAVYLGQSGRNDRAHQAEMSWRSGGREERPGTGAEPTKAAQGKHGGVQVRFGRARTVHGAGTVDGDSRGGTPVIGLGGGGHDTPFAAPQTGVGLFRARRRVSQHPWRYMLILWTSLGRGSSGLVSGHLAYRVVCILSCGNNIVYVWV